jgi:hypothetical protein
MLIPSTSEVNFCRLVLPGSACRLAGPKCRPSGRTAARVTCIASANVRVLRLEHGKDSFADKTNNSFRGPGRPLIGVGANALFLHVRIRACENRAGDFQVTWETTQRFPPTSFPQVQPSFYFLYRTHGVRRLVGLPIHRALLPLFSMSSERNPVPPLSHARGSASSAVPSDWAITRV